jgi:hypothetical protein
MLPREFRTEPLAVRPERLDDHLLVAWTAKARLTEDGFMDVLETRWNWIAHA